MAWPALSAFGAKPLLFNVESQLDKPLFTVWLDEKGYVENTPGGMFTYGAIDTQNCDAAASYVALSAEKYWQFTMSGVTMGSYSNNQNYQVISDTGTRYVKRRKPSKKVFSRIRGDLRARTRKISAVARYGLAPRTVF